MIEYGKILRMLRIAKDLSITELARQIGVSESYISEIERGKKNPSYEVCEKYACGLKISVEKMDRILCLRHRDLSFEQALLRILSILVGGQIRVEEEKVGDDRKEIVVEQAAKKIINGIGKDLASVLVEEYANLAKWLAENSTDDQLHDLVYVGKLLGKYLPGWDCSDWYDLAENARRIKYREKYEKQTAEKVFNDMPFFAREAAQSALYRILEADAMGVLNKGTDAGEKMAAEILCKMFGCAAADVEDAATKYNAKKEKVSVADSEAHKPLLGYIEVLRGEIWKQGEVLELMNERNR